MPPRYASPERLSLLLPTGLVGPKPLGADAVADGLARALRRAGPLFAALDDETVPGEYRLPRDQAADFVTQLKRLDGHVVIEASDANGERYRVTAAEDLR